jgi:uncharacterized membrane-anchored protein
MRKVIVVLAALVLLIAVNVGIAGREKLLADGQVVLLELAPVDPRSLMQGDYMALRYAIASQAMRPDQGDGRIVATLDPHGVARFKRFADAGPVAAGEVLLRYRVRGGAVKFATNAFFFQEGTAARYERARYGEFRVAPDGDMILTGLRGPDYAPL